ncbi:MAG: nucleotidyltransferase domain-containing protein [Gemmatimonadota bacterium]|jgi:predicted nucleotidyltransferase
MRKLREDSQPVDVDDRLPALVDRLGREPGLVALILYGSYGTERQVTLSDVDLAVVFRGDALPSAPDRLRLINLVMDLLGEEDVSLSFLGRAPLPFQHEVLRTGRPLLVRDEVAFADFRERVVRRYCDFVIDYRVILEDYDEGLRIEYGAR